MTAKEYLLQAAVLKRRIKHLEDRIAELRSEASAPKAIRYDKDMIQSGSSGDALANYLIRLEHEESRLLKCKADYIDLYEEMWIRISKVMPGMYADVLYMRYLEQKSLVVIAEELNYSYEWTCRIHGRALQAFSRVHSDIL